MNRSSKVITTGLVFIVTTFLSLVSTPNSSAAILEFNLDVPNIPTGRLLSADGADVIIETVEFRDASDPNVVRILPGVVRYTPLVVTYNRDQDRAQRRFHEGITEWVDDARSNSTFSTRRNAALITSAQNGTELERVDLSHAFPIYFNPVTPDLATGTQRLYELHLALENFRVTTVPESSSIILPAVICALWLRRSSRRHS